MENFGERLALFIPGTSESGKYKQWQPHKFAKIAKWQQGLVILVKMVEFHKNKVVFTKMDALCPFWPFCAGP